MTEGGALVCLILSPCRARVALFDMLCRALFESAADPNKVVVCLCYVMVILLNVMLCLIDFHVSLFYLLLCYSYLFVCYLF